MGAWPETVERWKKEGFDPARPPAFQEDRWDVYGGWFFPNPPFEKKIISQDNETVLYINHEGILMRELKNNPYSSMPQFVKFPIETKEEYRKFRKEKMQPDISKRIGADYKEKLSAYKNRDFPLIIISDRWGGFFGGLRAMLGVERACTMFYDDPAFVEEMMDNLADFIIEMLGKILEYTDIDVYGFWEDMAYKTGPLVGPQLFRKFALPRYKRVVDFVRSKGVKFICLDSDGDMESLIPIWLDAGINILYPFEVQCGMDVNKIRNQYGKDLRMWYGIDKRVLAIGKEAIDKELKRVEPLVKEGGYIPGLDHSIPPDVSYSNYLYYSEKLWELVQK
jgi:uroporphyrinogen decarboxylase